jgi:hypothetical protein
LRASWFAVDTGVSVVGVAHARCGPLGEHRIQQCCEFGVGAAADLGRAVGLLFALGQVAALGQVGVGQHAVLVEQQGQMVGGDAQVFWSKPARQLGQLCFSGLAGGVVDEAGQLLEEPANDLHMFGADVTSPLRGRGAGQLWLQELAGDRGSRP